MFLIIDQELITKSREIIGKSMFPFKLQLIKAIISDVTEGALTTEPLD